MGFLTSYLKKRSINYLRPNRYICWGCAAAIRWPSIWLSIWDFFLKSVNLIKPGIGDIPEQVLSTAKGDVLVAIAFRRYTREVVKIAEKMKRKKAYIIAVTNSHLSPIAQLADMSLVVETEIPTYIESFTAPMSLLNALITAVALKKKKQALPALKRLETEFEEFETYINKL